MLTFWFNIVIRVFKVGSGGGWRIKKGRGGGEAGGREVVLSRGNEVRLGLNHGDKHGEAKNKHVRLM